MSLSISKMLKNIYVILFTNGGQFIMYKKYYTIIIITF